MGALGSLSKSATVAFWYISVISTFGFGVLFLFGWLSEEFATSEKWKARRKCLIILAVIGVAGEQVSTIAEFAFSEHLQTISDKEVKNLQSRLADRQLTDAQLSRIARKLKSFAGQEFKITAYWDVKESLKIANRIYAALIGAGWTFIPPKSATFLMAGSVGVLVWTHPGASESTKKAAAALISALNQEDTASEPREQNPANPRSDEIELSVGTKP
jgi:hypothetical protein